MSTIFSVSRTLDGAAEHLKERTIGVEVFGRAPDYDTATDHVVRSSAGEVRKRLAQYYMESGRSREIRIDVHPGSYIPRFIAAQLAPQETDAIDIAPVSVLERSPITRLGVGRWRSRSVAISMAVAGAAVLSMLAIGAEIRHSAGRVLNGFWQPVLQSPNPVLVCIAARNPAAQAPQPGPAGVVDNQIRQTLSAGTIRSSETVFLDDAIALAKFAGWLQQRAKPYRIVLPARVTFADLQTSQGF